MLPNLRVLVALVPVTIAVGCGGSSSQPRSASSQTTSGATNPYNDLRTVDSAGYVDNAGRTEEVTAGATPTVRGRGEGIVAPRPPESTSGSSEVPPSGAPATAPATATEAVPRLVRALCDRESACERVGTAARYASADSCMAEKRQNVESLLEAGCPKGVASSAFGACLGAIRVASCEPSAVQVGTLPACRAEAVCPK
ncbi:hypothetical protein AKJ09_09912 [Labilithrix luteola]|uniref:Uncharacterized protein n=1 Tax=Labilithrix luteola TaxID=1391654 RepID=A0A0K1QBY2_9BACT|nr:DUF6184 family natural product biosynthesis lipoprotein [Labilithrix luteola]AKV03249.1 hypothetical protein AKJ09_09912 [Labilithrix luteola]